MQVGSTALAVGVGGGTGGAFTVTVADEEQLALGDPLEFRLMLNPTFQVLLPLAHREGCGRPRPQLDLRKDAQKTLP